MKEMLNLIADNIAITGNNLIDSILRSEGVHHIWYFLKSAWLLQTNYVKE